MNEENWDRSSSSNIDRDWFAHNSHHHSDTQCRGIEGLMWNQVRVLDRLLAAVDE